MILASDCLLLTHFLFQSNDFALIQVWDDLCGVTRLEKEDVSDGDKHACRKEWATRQPGEEVRKRSGMTETFTDQLELDGMYGDVEQDASTAPAGDCRLVSANEDASIKISLGGIGDLFQYETAKQHLSDTCSAVDSTCKRAMSLFLDPKKSPFQALHSIREAAAYNSGKKVSKKSTSMTACASLRAVIFDFKIAACRNLFFSIFSLPCAPRFMLHTCVQMLKSEETVQYRDAASKVRDTAYTS